MTKSGEYMGVSYCPEMPPNRRWKAEIKVGRLTKHIGYFADERTAAIQYDLRAAQMGKPCNILKPKNGI